MLALAPLGLRAYNFTMAAATLRANATSQVIRAADRSYRDLPAGESTPESRMSLVWELTLQCLAMQGGGSIEPRLQRSAVRIQRPRR